MISLGAIEAAIKKILPEEIEILTTSIPDSRKGEKVILLFAGEIEETDLKSLISETDIPPLMVPAVLLKVDEIPKLGTGKSDFKQAKALALELNQPK